MYTSMKIEQQHLIYIYICDDLQIYAYIQIYKCRQVKYAGVSSSCECQCERSTFHLSIGASTDCSESQSARRFRQFQLPKGMSSLTFPSSILPLTCLHVSRPRSQAFLPETKTKLDNSAKHLSLATRRWRGTQQSKHKLTTGNN